MTRQHFKKHKENKARKPYWAPHILALECVTPRRSSLGRMKRALFKCCICKLVFVARQHFDTHEESKADKPYKAPHILALECVSRGKKLWYGLGAALKLLWLHPIGAVSSQTPTRPPWQNF